MTVPTVVHVDRDSWPESVSDGLTLPCTHCSTAPRFDYRVSNEFWAQWGAGPNVLCLPCLDERSGGVGLAEALIEIQWTGTGHTVCTTPRARYEYPPATVPTSPTDTGGTDDGLRAAIEALDDLIHVYARRTGWAGEFSHSDIETDVKPILAVLAAHPAPTEASQ